jgi:hypothetical protein
MALPLNTHTNNYVFGRGQLFLNLYAAGVFEGRRFIGMERETEYFHGIAVPRVRAAVAQPQLLAPAPQPVAEQQGFDLE